MQLNEILIFKSLSRSENTCRTCLKLFQGNSNKKCIFHPSISNKIESLFSMKLIEEDGLPNLICGTCLEKLNNAVEFKNQVEMINEKLTQYLYFSRNGNRVFGTDTVVSNLEEQIISEDVKDELNQNGGKYKNHGIYADPTEEAQIKLDISDNSCEAKDTVASVTNGDPNKSSDRETKAKKEERSVTCPTCTKKLKSARSLKAHLRIHGVIEKKLECGKCGQKYTNQYDLRVHLRKHSGIRPFCCKVCQKTFADKRCFEKHKKIHSGEKLFKCELCDKSFIHSYTLKTHLRVHSGEKPFICAKCGHSFTTATQLKLHTRIHHTQEKPYSCNVCSKVFASSSGLSNHKMTHTGERKFICSVCGKGSRTTSDLKCHLRTHTGERPFNCTFPDCDKKYKTNSQLCAHVRTHTSVVLSK